MMICFAFRSCSNLLHPKLAGLTGRIQKYGKERIQSIEHTWTTINDSVHRVALVGGSRCSFHYIAFATLFDFSFGRTTKVRHHELLAERDMGALLGVDLTKNQCEAYENNATPQNKPRDTFQIA